MPPAAAIVVSFSALDYKQTSELFPRQIKNGVSRARESRGARSFEQRLNCSRITRTTAIRFSECRFTANLFVVCRPSQCLYNLKSKTAAGARRTPAQMSAGHNSLSAAFADATPARFTSLIRSLALDDGESPENVPGQIDEIEARPTAASLTRRLSARRTLRTEPALPHPRFRFDQSTLTAPKSLRHRESSINPLSRSCSPRRTIPEGI